MGRYTGKTCRLICMLGLTTGFFLVEIVVGYLTNSLALVGDSYHMLSDVVALCVGLASVRISKWNTPKNTFGWARSEVLGALVNSVFLLALCFTIFVEALQRMFHNDEIEDEDLMLIVGGIGLGINLIGLFLFHEHSHGHSHGGHGHSHGGSKSKDKQISRKHAAEEEMTAVLSSASDSPQYPSDASSNVVISQMGPQNENSKSSSSAQLNMKGVFLHVMGDALGSVIVIISALVIKYVEADWKFKVDPALSLILVCIIICTAAPLFRESALILLQTVPNHIRVKNLESQLVEKIDGVLAVHEFHIWQLTGNRIIATAHIRCQNLRDYSRVAEDVKGFFHNEGIHSTTIQPEFVELEEMPAERACALECGPEKTCFTDTCCATKETKIDIECPEPNGTPTRMSSNSGNNTIHIGNNAASL